MDKELWMAGLARDTPRTKTYRLAMDKLRLEFKDVWDMYYSKAKYDVETRGWHTRDDEIKNIADLRLQRTFADEWQQIYTNTQDQLNQ